MFVKYLLSFQKETTLGVLYWLPGKKSFLLKGSIFKEKNLHLGEQIVSYKS